MEYKAHEIYGCYSFVAGDDITLAFKLTDSTNAVVSDLSAFNFVGGMESRLGGEIRADDVVINGSVFYITFSSSETSDMFDGTYNVHIKIYTSTVSYVVWRGLIKLSKEIVDWGSL